MLSHLKHKPSSERLIEMINEVAKLEFDFLVNGLKIELVNIELDDVLQLIDRKTRDLKLKMFKIEKKKNQESKKMTVNNATDENSENTPVSKESTHKFVLDEDFWSNNHQQQTNDYVFKNTLFSSFMLLNFLI